MQPENKKTTFNNVLKLWYIPVFSFLVPFGYPLSFLYTGLTTKNKKWMVLFVITLIVMILSFTMLMSSNLVGLGVFFLFLSWIFTLVYQIATANQFLALCSQSIPSGPAIDTSLSSLTNTPVNEVKQMGTKLIGNLKKWKGEIESVQLQNDIDELVKISSLVMQRNDEDSWKFFTRYSDKLDNMLAKYDEIENTRLNSPEILRSMELIEKSVGEIVVAFRNEINEMYKRDLVDLDADTKAFIHDLRNKGLID